MPEKKKKKLIIKKKGEKKEIKGKTNAEFEKNLFAHLKGGGKMSDVKGSKGKHSVSSPLHNPDGHTVHKGNMTIKKPKKKPKKLVIVKKEGPKRKEDTFDRNRDKKLTKKELRELGNWRYLDDKQLSHHIRVMQRYQSEQNKKGREKRDRDVEKAQARHKKAGTFKYN